MSTFDEDAVKRRQRAQQVALFRYQLICPALEPGLSTKQRGKVVRGIAGRSHDGPFGGQVRYSRDTLDRWIRRYRAGGFDALSPSIRQPGARIDAQVFELAAALKRENPGRTAAQVMRILRASTGWAPSESTLLRHFHRLELMGPAAGQAGGVRPVRGRRTERAVGRRRPARPEGRRPEDVPVRVPGRPQPAGGGLPVRVRRGHRPVGRRAGTRAGRPRRPRLASMSTTDRPSSMPGCCGPARSSGSGWCTATPHRPQGRGKIERFFRTVNDQFLVEVHDTTAEDIAAKRYDPGGGAAGAERAVHRLGGDRLPPPRPLRDRADPAGTAGPPGGTGPARPGRCPPRGTLTEAFLWSEQRVVTKTATVSLARQHLPGRRRPGRPEGRVGVLPVRPGTHRDPLPGQRPTGTALPHHITRHAHPKARPETPEPAPVAGAPGSTTWPWSPTTHHQRVAADQTDQLRRPLPRTRRAPARRHSARRTTCDDITRRHPRAAPTIPPDEGEATG